VDVGSCTTIDRATWDRLLLEKGKLDNQIQVAHNVEIGENIIAAQTGIAGSTRLVKLHDWWTSRYQDT
jgi:UDP-3-O-[3-hydroxymyristoyl] glucosamine N-acyltransferase